MAARLSPRCERVAGWAKNVMVFGFLVFGFLVFIFVPLVAPVDIADCAIGVCGNRDLSSTNMEEFIHLLFWSRCPHC